MMSSFRWKAVVLSNTFFMFIVTPVQVTTDRTFTVILRFNVSTFIRYNIRFVWLNEPITDFIINYLHRKIWTSERVSNSIFQLRSALGRIQKPDSTVVASSDSEREKQRRLLHSLCFSFSLLFSLFLCVLTGSSLVVLVDVTTHWRGYIVCTRLVINATESTEAHSQPSCPFYWNRLQLPTVSLPTRGYCCLVPVTTLFLFSSSSLSFSHSLFPSLSLASLFFLSLSGLTHFALETWVSVISIALSLPDTSSESHQFNCPS